MTKPLLTLILLIISFTSTFAQGESKEESSISGIERAKAFLKTLQTHYANGEYQLHKDYSDSLLVVAKDNNLHKMHVYALVNQAVFYNNRNGKLRAIELYHEALEQCKLIPEDFRTRTVVLVNMGNTYNNIGFYNKAITTMKEVLIVADSTENSDMVKAAALVGLANNYHELKNFEKTLEYAKRAKILGEKTQNETILASSLNSIIDAYVNIKEYDKALVTGQTALKLSISEKPTKKRGWLLLNMGIANYHLEKLDIALNYLKEGMSLAKEKGLFEIEMYCQEYLSKVYEQKNDYKASHTAQKKYAQLRETFLADKKDASNADLKKDIVSKDETIAESNEELLIVANKRKQVVIWSATALVLLSGLLLFYIRRKKAIESEQTKLRARYLNLQQTVVENKKGLSHKPSSSTTKGYTALKPYKNSSLTPVKRQEFKKKILAFMDKEKPFLDAGLNQSDLAAKIGISSHHFSEVLHYGFEQNFYSFINSYRVLEAQNLMKGKKGQDSKIIAIAFDSGFKSKTSFNRVFKKLTGQTPSEFRAGI